MKKVKIHNPAGLPVMAYREMQGFQGDLKLEPSAEAVEKLKRSILKHGIFVPKFVWVDSQGVHRILDGHQTRAALEALELEGYEVPPIPYVGVRAKNEKDAAEKLLQLNSRYAEMNSETKWFEQIGFNGDELEALLEAVEVPDLDIGALLPPVDFSIDKDRGGVDGSLRWRDEGKSDEGGQVAGSGDVGGYAVLTREKDKEMRPTPLEQFDPAGPVQESERIIIAFKSADEREWLESTLGIKITKVLYRASELMNGIK
ncbi:MAG: hypothetical protein AB1457_16220 [Chloroflexota bacterium]